MATNVGSAAAAGATDARPGLPFASAARLEEPVPSRPPVQGLRCNVGRGLGRAGLGLAGPPLARARLAFQNASRPFASASPLHMSPAPPGPTPTRSPLPPARPRASLLSLTRSPPQLLLSAAWAIMMIVIISIIMTTGLRPLRGMDVLLVEPWVPPPCLWMIIERSQQY